MIDRIREAWGLLDHWGETDLGLANLFVMRYEDVRGKADLDALTAALVMLLAWLTLRGRHRARHARGEW